nr:hypothetical protein [Chloroflexota bacterium]
MERGSLPVMNTFVVRLWTERSAEGAHWRGRIEHVQSRESAIFSDTEGMLDFIGRFVEMNRGKESTG